MERWLLLSNCQTFGLANSMNLINPDCEVVGIDIWDYQNNISHYNNGVAAYDRLIIHPEIMEVAGCDFSTALRVDMIPGIHFEGYHADICFAQHNGNVLKGPLGDYQSLIALAAHSNGLSVSEALPLYNGRIYERCGYFDAWSPSRDQLLSLFKQYGLDIRDAFIAWGRRRAFMYSMNHPRIETVYDIARLFLLNHGIHVRETDLRPADNLANGPCYPIFPELGEALGIEGSILFKPNHKYKYLTLEQFLHASFELFDHYPPGVLGVGSYQSRLERVQAVIRGEA